MPATLTTEQLEQFGGSEHLWKHPLYGPIQYTAGVRHVAIAGRAWWLLDIIATTARLDPSVSQHWMQVWTLTVHADQAPTLICTDGDEHVIYEHPLFSTDFPLPPITIWVVEQVMMLPSEW